MGEMADIVPSTALTVRLRLRDLFGGDDVIREMAMSELEPSERGVGVGPMFYPWRRVVSYEWELVEPTTEEAVARPRQLIVRVLVQGIEGPEEFRVAADRFELGPWTVSLTVLERVEPERRRTVFRRIAVPWHRILEYERLLAEIVTAGDVPDRPDMSGRQLPEGSSQETAESVEIDRVVIDIAAIEEASAEEPGADAPEPAEAGSAKKGAREGGTRFKRRPPRVR